MSKLIFIVFCLISLSTHANERLIALTIDDLPFVGEAKSFHLNMIIETLKANAVPATGFVITREITADTWPALIKFKEAGLGIGNHSHSHTNVNHDSTATYIHEQIDVSDEILSPLITHPKFYRFPYMNMGAGEKKASIIHHLMDRDYRIAPITIDSKDFIFNQLLLGVPEKNRRHFLTALKPCYMDFIWEQTMKAESLQKQGQAQILLIHANLLNAYLLQDIINRYRQEGYVFITLDQALKTHPTPGAESKEKRHHRAKIAWARYFPWS